MRVGVYKYACVCGVCGKMCISAHGKKNGSIAIGYYSIQKSKPLRNNYNTNLKNNVNLALLYQGKRSQRLNIFIFLNFIATKFLFLSN